MTGDDDAPRETKKSKRRRSGTTDVDAEVEAFRSR
jgi:hypothetical protein